MRQHQFNFEDFLTQLEQMRKPGLFERLFPSIPRLIRSLLGPDFARAEKEMARYEASVRSMTRQERRRPEIIDAPRRRRIAAGAGVPVLEVDAFLKQFQEMRAMAQDSPR